MKLTVTSYNKTITLETKNDDHDIWSLRDEFIVPMILALGFHPSVINTLFNEELIGLGRERDERVAPDQVEAGHDAG
jgi:hypothetical protein